MPLVLTRSLLSAALATTALLGACGRNLPPQGDSAAATTAPGGPAAPVGTGPGGGPTSTAPRPGFGEIGGEEVIPGPSATTPGTSGPTGTVPPGVGGTGMVIPGPAGTGGGASPTPEPDVVGVGGDGMVVVEPEVIMPPMVDETVVCMDEVYADPTAPGQTFPYDTIAAQVNDKLASMSNPEKALMMGGTLSCPNSYWCNDDRSSQFSTQDVAGVSGFKFRDGPRGLSEWEEESNAGRKATAFPASIARAATFDLGLEHSIGAAICTEALASGWNNVLAPTVNLTMHPSAGRAQESYGEDPWVNGKMGSAFVIGCQQYAQACPKHYAANEVETNRVVMSAEVDERTLRENYTRAFEMIIKGADPACIMASYNSVNGTHAAENTHLLKDLLRTAFGFKGFVLSDWGAMVSGANSANAGMEVEMPERVFFNGIESQVQGTVVDGAVRNILTQKYRFGFGATAGDCCDDTAQVTGARARFNNTTYLEHADHVALAEEAARKSAVLLKNDSAVLPITAAKYPTVAVLAPTLTAGCVKGQTGCPKGAQSFWDDWEYSNGMGSWARSARMGDKGSSQVFPSRRVSPLEGMQTRAPAGVTIVEGTDPALAAQADLAVVFVALTSFDEGEEWQNGGDRESLELQDGQAEFIASVAAQGKPTVVVMYGGAPITMEGWKNQAQGIVMAWYPGMVGAYATADLLYGTANFSGRLPQTWPVQASDAAPVASPTAQNPNVTYPYLLGYRHHDAEGIAPLFPFGYGLSYTTYGYDALSLGCGTTTKNGVVRVSAEITNTGSVAGTEVVQVYVGFPSGPDSAIQRPAKEYKAAVRVDLEPGITKRITIPLPVKDWAYFDTGVNDWVVESGAHTIMVGPNSGGIPAHMIGTVTVQ
jgi:beta-glucosidase